MEEASASAPEWCAKVTLEYDGSNFVGSQRQRVGRTVQGEVEAALLRLTGAMCWVALAGRTDAGVHATGQVASCHVPERFTPDGLRRGLNAHLPLDLAAVAVERAGPGFHARFSAISRRYAYIIWNGPDRAPLVRTTAWHVRSPLDLEAMRESSRVLIGTHDFASFAGAGHGVPHTDQPAMNTTRTLTELTIEAAGAGHGQRVRCEVEAEAFLPHMVRNIVGALVEVGLGRWDSATVRRVLAAADRRQSAPTAPAHGVILLQVSYPVVSRAY